MIPIRRGHALSLALCLLVAFTAFAAGPLVPYLVKDVTPGERIAPPRLNYWGRTLGEVVFFGVAEDEPGLWRTDGTASGTHRIYDGRPEWHLDDGKPPAKSNGFLFYPVLVDGGSSWLYRTDGTTPGTTPVKEISGWYGGAPCGDGKLCFATVGSRVAVTDGTAAGTTELLSTASDHEAWTDREMTAMGSRVFFNAYDDQNGLCMIVPAGLGDREVCGELWTTDGTLAGTHLVLDILPGSAPGAPENLFASSAGKLYFAAADPANRKVARAWVSDGTAEGTRMLPTKASDWLFPPYFTEIAGRVFFTTSDGDLFETDGTSVGTRSLRSRFATTDFILVAIDGVGGKALLWAGYYARPELWSYDGTELTKIADIPNAFSYLGHLQSTGLSYFVGDRGDFWSTDGTAAGTVRRFGIPANSARMYSMAVTPTRLYYGNGNNRYVTDGTEAGTHQIDLKVRVPNSTLANKRTALNGKYFFVTPNQVGASDGTQAGTQILIDDRGFDPFAHEGHTYFYQDARLWKTDGTTAGTIHASDWLGAEWPRPPAFIGSQAIFAAGGSPDRLLRRDPDGVLHELGVTGHFGPFVSVAGGVAFWRDSQLMFTDGTVAGTRTVASNFKSANDVVPLGTRAVFGAVANAETTLRLWVTDFTVEGTAPVKDIPGSRAYDDVIPILTWRNLSIFRVEPLAPPGVWRSDGTADGTFQLTTGWFDAVLADGDELVLVRFTYPGYEVWTSDGTIAGTKKRDGYPDVVQAGEPYVMPGGGVGVIYRVNSKELQIRNHRTKAVHVIDASGMGGLGTGIGIGNLVFFRGYRGSSGSELWAVSLDGSAPSPPSSVRIEYRGTEKTPTGLGAVFHVHIDANGSKAPSVIATTSDGTLTAERDYVPFTREIVFESDHDVTLVVPLRHGDAKGTLNVVLSTPVNATITQGMATATVGVYGRQRSARH